MNFRKKLFILQNAVISSLVLLLIVGCSAAETPTSSDKTEYPVFEGGTSKLAFASQKTTKDQYEIFVYDFATKNLSQLTTNGFADTSPSWSPDGQKLVYSSNVNGIYQLFTMKADGSEQTQLAISHTDDTQPAWEQGLTGGTKIAYQSNGNGDLDIYIYNMNNKTSKAITGTDSQETQAVWSPDGQQIAFVSNNDGDFEIYVMGASGSDPLQLTKNEAYDSSPTWSPDGKQIAFISKRSPDQHFQLFMMNADGSQETQLTRSDFTISSPTWSPDGKTLAFVSESSQGSQVLAIDLATRQIYKIISGFYNYAGLSWMKPPESPTP